MKSPGSAGAAWLGRQVALGRRAAMPVAVCHLVVVLLSIVQAWVIASQFGVFLLGRAVDNLAANATVFAICAVARAGLVVFADQASVAAGMRGRHRVRHECLQALLDAGPGLLRGRHSGELVALVVDRVEMLDGFFARWSPAVLLALAGPLAVALVLLWVDRFAGAVVMCAGLLVPAGMALSGIGAALASRRQFAALARLQTRFLDRVRGIATIVLAGRAEAEAEALAVAAADLRRRTMAVLRVAFLSSTVLDCAMAGCLVVLAVHYGTGLLNGGPRPAIGLFALLLVPEFFAPLRAYAAAYQDQMQARGMGDAVAELPAPAAEIAAPLTIRTIEAHGVSVAFEDVTLTWDPTRGPALDGVSFRVPAGETLVVAGPSGAGKSSIIELLLGFARPDSGLITLNGVPIATIVPAALSRMTAWIGQTPLLFAGTLRENIRFARTDATDAEVEDAAAKARLGALADSLPLGLDTLIGESGHGLSGGQAQRVAIARAFLRRAPLLLLDEPTAHLDPATEAEVLDSLRRLAIGRTVILVTHSAAAQTFPGRRLDLRQGRVLGSASAASRLALRGGVV